MRLKQSTFDDLPVGNEPEEVTTSLQTDDLYSICCKGKTDWELDMSALSAIEDDDDDIDDISPEPESKVATLGMGDSSAAAKSISDETRSDVQFEGQDDTLLIDVFNEDNTVDSLLFEGLEEPTTPQPPSTADSDGGDAETDINALLSSILDEPDEAEEGDTQIMDRSQLLAGLEKPEAAIEDTAVHNEDDELAMLLSELEQDVTAPIPIPEIPPEIPDATEEVADTKELDDVLEEFDIEFDFDEPEQSETNVEPVDDAIEKPVDIESILSADDDELDIDALLAGYEDEGC